MSRCTSDNQNSNMKQEYDLEESEKRNSQTSFEMEDPFRDPDKKCFSDCKLLKKAVVYFAVLILFGLGFSIGVVVGLYTLSGDVKEGTDICGPAAVKLNHSGTSVSYAVPISEPEPTVTSQSTIASTRGTKPPTVMKAPSRRTTTPQPTTVTPQTCRVCPKPNAILSDISSTENLFAPLTVEEMTSIYQYFWKENLVSHPHKAEHKLHENYITSITLNPPDKSAVLRYLDNGGTHPGRYARVYVVRGANSVPDLMEYKVGPLGKGKTMTKTELLDDGEIHFNRRPKDAHEYIALHDTLSDDLHTLEPLLKESFDGASYDEGITALYYPGEGRSADERLTIFFLAMDAPTVTLNVLPVSGTISNPGTNSSDWYAHSFYYLNQGPYKTARQLLSAYQGGEIRKFAFPTNYRDVMDTHILSADKRQPFRKFSDRAAPKTYEPEGPRYTIEGYRVSWMDWEFEISTNQIHGAALFDVKFKGDRVIYENSLNDITLVYSSGSPGAGLNFPVLSDSTYGLGVYSGPIMGVDCPEHATILNATHWSTFIREAITNPAICVFEADGQEAIWRHQETLWGGLREMFLVVRAPLTVGNYDYTVDFRFRLDGELKTTMTATGYLYTAFWDPDDPLNGKDRSSTPFGFRVTPYSLASLHDHTYAFKVDLDILGTKNDVDVIRWKRGDVLSALQSQGAHVKSRPSYFNLNVTRYVEYDTLKKEGGKVLDPTNPEFWVVSNRNRRNKWGAKRGYRIIPLSAATDALPADHPVLNSMSYLKYHCAFTKRKESEQYISTAIYDLHRLEKPLTSLDEMMNEESIEDEDLVAWVATRFLHLPTAEDVPMTPHIQVGYVLKPFNYFNSTPLFDMPNNFDQWNYFERPSTFKSCYET